jgi:hypothetical protein
MIRCLALYSEGLLQFELVAERSGNHILGDTTLVLPVLRTF